MSFPYHLLNFYVIEDRTFIAQHTV